MRDVIKRIEADGWKMVRDNGSHKIFKKPGDAEEVVVNGHAGDDVPRGTLSRIRRQTGLPLR